MLKASRDAIPEGKPLDPTLLHDGFLRVQLTKNIKIFVPNTYAVAYVELWWNHISSFEIFLLS